MTTETTAQKIAALFGTDGQCWETSDGRTLDAVCRKAAGRPDYRDDHSIDVYRYSFDDGSSIVVAGTGWDFGLPGGCYCWEGAQRGHADSCDMSYIPA